MSSTGSKTAPRTISLSDFLIYPQARRSFVRGSKVTQQENKWETHTPADL